MASGKNNGASGDKIHAFENAGLGEAPFRLVGIEERRGPIITTDPKTGIETRIGAPGQPMGCCAYCSTGIAECCMIESADGKRFIVGKVCVGRTGDQGLVSTTKKAMRKIQKEKRHAREAARIESAKGLLAREDVRTVLKAGPHPVPYMAAERKLTRLDWADWMMGHAGTAGKIEVARACEAIATVIDEGAGA